MQLIQSVKYSNIPIAITLLNIDWIQPVVEKYHLMKNYLLGTDQSTEVCTDGIKMFDNGQISVSWRS